MLKTRENSSFITKIYRNCTRLDALKSVNIWDVDRRKRRSQVNIVSAACLRASQPGITFQQTVATRFARASFKFKIHAANGVR